MLTEAAIGLGRRMARWPVPLVTALGRGLGWLFWWLPNKRRAIARRNLQLCFPHWSAQQRRQCLKANLVSTGQGLTELLLSWWRVDDDWLDAVEISGFEHLQQALQSGQAPLLLSCHLHAMEVGARAINRRLRAQNLPVGHLLARQHNNKKLQAQVDAGRRAFVEKTIDKKDMKQVLRSLRSGHPVFLAADQNFSYQCVFAPFFGVPAATVTVPARLAKRFAVPVLPCFAYRIGRHRWKVEIHPAAATFQRAEPEQAACEMNRLFEQAIGKAPDQYLWVHRRFKNHPQGRNHVYRDLE
jgi:KDO2-lipid IV(A) lauroyltransferase